VKKVKEFTILHLTLVRACSFKKIATKILIDLKSFCQTVKPLAWLNQRTKLITKSSYINDFLKEKLDKFSHGLLLIY
jgi:hypothetical protein